MVQIFTATFRAPFFVLATEFIHRIMQQMFLWVWGACLCSDATLVEFVKFFQVR